ncbi:CusA/CzcA family heavy metal efflux RND transporter [Bowmanella yangjiangensis]|uniref:Efflux RND transporter permease subunit n=1 Tax=Bowmanella yangjiangensis TaxID=2811230 RepID=A0ABS3CXW5_9ALTE|nr:CusA/CzcA family heavy metal efflux RND transporter [Bowmanella yangjiangensis]MBN7820479.1 efflux RND transporter permease subunit [Bowmanella yangjiangensis]
MLAALLRLSLTQRLFVGLLAILLAGAGMQAWRTLPIDAFPDISPIQVKVIIKVPGMTTTEIESQVTRLVETELLGIPHQAMLRSTTKYAITVITLDFSEGTDIYWARQQVSERLAGIWSSLPQGISGGVAPMSTPLSEMFMFTVDNPAMSLQARRELLDWYIRPALRSVAGVADVNSLGGFVKTYEILPDPLKLQQFGLGLEDIERVILETNQNTGLGRINKGTDSLILRTEGRFADMSELQNMVLTSSISETIRLHDVAEVSVGHLSRYGAVTRNAEEAVQGLVIALKDSNTAEVVRDVKAKLAELTPTLPEGTKIEVFYDRANLIETATDTLIKALVEAVVLVIIVLALFLGNVRAAFVVSLSLPLAALGTFALMKVFGLSANLMSLGGLVIAIGMLVDASVVMVENAVTHLHRQTQLPLLHQIFRACHEVATPVLAGTLIVVIVFSPLLTLTGLEGKLFSPVAKTIVFAMLSAMLLAFTLIPVLSSLLLNTKVAEMPRWVMRLQALYQGSLLHVLAHPRPYISLLLTSLLLAGGLFVFVGKSFMPQLDEGDIIIQFEKPPSITLDASIALDKQIEQTLLERVPEILNIVARTGSDELGLDPMGLNETDVFLQLKPVDQWRQPDKQWLVDEIRALLEQFPGMNINFTQPIQMRVSEMLTGTSGDVAIKVFGHDLDTLTALAGRIGEITEQVQGSEDVQVALVEGGQYLNIRARPEMAAMLGVSTQSLSTYLLGLVEGRTLSEIVEGEIANPIRFANSLDKSSSVKLRAVGDLLQQPILLPDGSSLPLEQVADVSLQQGPLLIEREMAKRFVSVTTNVVGRDVVGFVEALQSSIDQRVSLPQGYRIEYGGEFENQQRAMQNLTLVVPVALLLIFVILFTTFHSLALSGLILGNIPFALMGGMVALYVSGEFLSVPASVGFIALLGVAVLNAVVMVSYFEQTQGVYADALEHIVQGAVRRLRPVLMTATTAMFGLIPLVFASGPGAEIQRPLAIVVIGGLITSTLTTLYLLPVFYRLMERSRA